MDFFGFCEEFASNFISVGESVYSALTTPIGTFLGESLSLPDWLIGLLPDAFLGYTMINVMFGVGLPVFIGIIIVKYIIS